VHWDEGIVYTEAGPTRTMAPRAKESIEELPLPLVTSDAKDYYRQFATAIKRGTPLPVTEQQMLRVMKVIDAALNQKPSASRLQSTSKSLPHPAVKIDPRRSHGPACPPTLHLA